MNFTHILERSLLTIEGIACLVSVCFISRKHAAKASFIFLLTQFFSWILGLVVVEFGWIEYPVRELAKANATSFLFEYFLLPIIAVFFVLYYPFSKPLKIKILYYAAIISSFTLIEYFVEKYTLIIKYNTWKWYWTFISETLVFYMVMVIYKWFYKIKKVFSL